MEEFVPSDEQLRSLLASWRTVAVVGLSPNAARPSHGVARYLQAHGYRIIPVRPAVAEVLGERAWASLEEIPEPVDVVDVFRNPAQALPVAEAAVRIGARALWLQEGVVNEAAARWAADHGLTVVMDRCMLKEHQRLLG